ncbi:MAG TPA: hypothetical protein PLD84_10525 [Chitinophagales bacterium]|nr:hypothetical protein [Chitinophagales bacterium]
MSDIDVQSFLECNEALHLDSAKIANKLIGKWELKSWYCGECSNPGTHNSDKVIFATFTSAGDFSVTEDSIIVSEGKWNLVGSNTWRLQSDSSLNHLYGMILFCNNEVLFNDSYTDGTDNLFERIN